jgi:signal transduction histidine kinase
MSRRWPAAALWTMAAAILALLVVDVVRQLQLGTAGASLTFFVVANGVAVAAALVVGRWPERRRMGALILLWLLTGVATDFGAEWPTSRLAATLWMLATGAEPATYALMALAYPSGVVRDRLERLLVVVGYPVCLAWMALPALFSDPRGCASCAPRVPSLLFIGTSFDFGAAGPVFWWSFIALGLCFIALVVRRLRRAPPGARPTLVPLGVAAVFAAANFVALRVVWLGGWNRALGALDWLDSAQTLVVPAAIFLGLATIRRRRGPVGELVVELGSAPPGQVRAALARTLGDPSLELGHWLDDRDQFVDEQGEPVEVGGAPGRAVTLIGPAGQPLAALLHDERLLGQRPLLEAAGSAARLALENTRLQAQLRAQLGELRASRQRIVEAGDRERRRVERNLHDGAQQRLLAISLQLAMLRERVDAGESVAGALGEVSAELQRAIGELRELARGIHPAILTEEGLPAAIESLADRALVPVRLRCDLDGRFAEPVEATAYFVVAESLANVAR